MFTEDDLLPISALQHLLFCERQCALIHVEGLWADNVLTVEGTHMHRRSDEGADEKRDGVRIVRALPLRSLRLGLAGRADVVEFHRGEPGAAWAPFPVEYKRGRAKRERCDQVQLCAQALCLEEMLGVEIPAGALFYGQAPPRRRSLRRSAAGGNRACRRASAGDGERRDHAACPPGAEVRALLADRPMPS